MSNTETTYRASFDRPRSADLASTLIVLERDVMTLATVRDIAAKHNIYARLRHSVTGAECGVIRPDGHFVGE